MDHIEIQLSKGLIAMVSPEDAALAQHKWHAVKARHTHYAARRVPGRTIYMHREILGVVEQGRTIMVDHENHNRLDNTRKNIRLCTRAQNARNRRDRQDYLGAHGVSFELGAWVARICHESQQIYLGRFPTEREAGIAYAAAEKVVLRGFSLGGAL